MRKKLGIPPNALVMGGAFRIVGVKRPLLWIEVAAQVAAAAPDAHFIIIGDGDLREAVRAAAAANGFADRLHLPGRVSNVGDWYRAMDVKLLTSEREGLPNVLIEAQHFAVPVVSADVGGASETIEVGVTGQLVAPHAEASQFAARVLEAFHDRAWHQAARLRSPQFVHDKFGADHVVDQLIKIFGIRHRRKAA